MKTLLRSRGFWFGLFGLLMIVGMWANSAGFKITGVAARTDCGGDLILTHSRGRIDFIFSHFMDEAPAARWIWHGSMDPLEPGQKISIFRSPRIQWHSGAEHRFYAIELPHWLLVALYLPLWGGLAFLWRAWKSRLMAAAIA